MGSIKETFLALRSTGRKALIPYITAGDPSLSVTAELLGTLTEADADLIEIGVPFSDPMADGPTIQRASSRSLGGGATLTGILDLIGDIRSKTHVPLVLFGYFNPILRFGLERFASRAAEVGIDGLLIVDLPPEEAHEIRRHTDPLGIDFITLVSPVSGSRRLQRIVADASGFLYYISVTGVTGTRTDLPPDVKGHIDRIRRMTDLPVVVGFGISTPHIARQAAAVADGVVVGSALVEIIERWGCDQERLLREVHSFISSLKISLKP